MDTKKFASIEIFSSGKHPIDALLRRNLDLNEVLFQSSEKKKGKEARDFEVHISVDSLDSLREFVLMPMQNPTSQELNWFEQSKNYIGLDQDFKLLINIEKEDIRIGAVLEKDIEAISAIWILIGKALEIVDLEDRVDIVSYMRFTSNCDGKILIISYTRGQSDRIVNVDISKAIKIPANQMLTTYYDSPDRLGRWHKESKWRDRGKSHDH